MQAQQHTYSSEEVAAVVAARRRHSMGKLAMRREQIQVELERAKQEGEEGTEVLLYFHHLWQYFYILALAFLGSDRGSIDEGARPNEFGVCSAHAQ